MCRYGWQAVENTLRATQEHYCGTQTDCLPTVEAEPSVPMLSEISDGIGKRPASVCISGRLKTICPVMRPTDSLVPLFRRTARAIRVWRSARGGRVETAGEFGQAVGRYPRKQVVFGVVEQVESGGIGPAAAFGAGGDAAAVGAVVAVTVHQTAKKPTSALAAIITATWYTNTGCGHAAAAVKIPEISSMSMRLRRRVWWSPCTNPCHWVRTENTPPNNTACHAGSRAQLPSTSCSPSGSRWCLQVGVADGVGAAQHGCGDQEQHDAYAASAQTDAVVVTVVCLAQGGGKEEKRHGQRWQVQAFGGEIP